jgi:O-antigen/teichoic acid export membrane protein
MARCWRDVRAVLGGLAIAQLVPIAASLVIARLVAPADYGVYAAWLGVVSVCAVFISLRYEVAIALERDAGDRLLAVRAVVAIILFVGLIVGSMLLVAAAAGAPLGLPAHFVGLGLLTAMLLASSTVLQLWLGAEGRFAELSVMRVIQAFSLSGSQVIGCWLLPSTLSLVIGYGVGVVVALAYACGWPLRPWLRGPAPSAGSGSIWDFLRRRRRFALLSLPAGVVGTAAEQLPILLVTSRFGAEAGGHLALTMRTLGAGIGLLVSAVLDVFRRESSAAFAKRGECRDAFDRSLKVLLVAAVALVVIVGPWAEELFVLAFGAAWLQSGTIALWLLPMFALRVMASPLSHMFFVADRQDIDLAWQVALVIFTVLALSTFDAYDRSIQLYGWGYAGLYAIYLSLAYRLSRGQSR